MKQVIKHIVVGIVLGVTGLVDDANGMCGSAAAVIVADAADDLGQARVVTHTSKSRVNAKDRDGDTPLHKAVKKRDVEEAQRLLNLGADPNLVNAYGRMPLYYACDVEPFRLPGAIERQQALIQVLYFAGADDPTLTREKLDSLCPAIVGGIYYAGILFQENIQDFCALSDEENQLSRFSMTSGLIGIVKEYIGAPHDIRNHPLQVRIVQNLGLEDSQAQADHLFGACESGDVLKLCEALYAGVDVNAWRNQFGQTFLHAAVSTDKIEIAKLLLEGGADIEAKCEGSGDTPLHYAVRRNKELVRFLLSQGANINEQGEGGATPLHVAVFGIGHTYDYKMVQLLLQNGADIETPDSLGRTPLQNAQMFCPKRMERLLKRHRASQNRKRWVRERCVVS